MRNAALQRIWGRRNRVFMQFAMDALDPATRYKLLVNTITPRPIAWVVTQDGEGRRNAAPYSFFNAMAYVPPQVMFSSTGDKPDRDGTKDSVSNIHLDSIIASNILGEEVGFAYFRLIQYRHDYAPSICFQSSADRSSGCFPANCPSNIWLLHPSLV